MKNALIIIAVINMSVLMGLTITLGYKYGVSQAKLGVMEEWRDRVYEQVDVPEYAPVDTTDNGGEQ